MGVVSSCPAAPEEEEEEEALSILFSAVREFSPSHIWLFSSAINSSGCDLSSTVIPFKCFICCPDMHLLLSELL